MKIISIYDYDPGLTYTSSFHALYFIYDSSSDLELIGVNSVDHQFPYTTGSLDEDLACW